jgi:hypothetical protein
LHHNKTLANKIIEDAASKPNENEIGIRIATPLAGPKPGNAPKTVPKKTSY